MVFITFSFKYWKFFTQTITVPLRTRDLEQVSADLILLRIKHALKAFGITMVVGDDDPS